MSKESGEIVSQPAARDRPRLRWLRSGISLGALVALVVGIGLSAGTLFGLRQVETLHFCADSCHEMQQPYLEYTQSVHFRNDLGVRATCADCHVPKSFFARIGRHAAASTELIGKLSGYIGTPTKYEQHRAAMAQAVWKELKADDSAECRSCHSFAAMDLAHQPRLAARAHSNALKPGSEETCIDCHTGIAHRLPPGSS